MKKTTIKSIFFAISIGLILSFFLGCDDKKTRSNSKKIVSLSTFILFDIANHIAGDTLELVRIIPIGVDIHSYEPTPQIMAKVEISDLVFYNGAGLEPWLASFNFKSRSIGIGNYIKLRSLDENEFDGHSHHDHQCAHSTLDPHFWLDVENMKRATDIMTYEFIALQPKYKEQYLENRDRYLDTLINLDNAYKRRLKSCAIDTIITNHNAFSYLSSKYNFHVKSLSGLSPDAQTSPRDVIRIIKDVNNFNAPVVFYENFQSDKSMKSLAQQANVKLDKLHTLGNITKDEAQNNLTYNDIMLDNLQKIAEARMCQ